MIRIYLNNLKREDAILSEPEASITLPIPIPDVS